MPRTVFPKQLQQNIDQIKKEIILLEAKLQSVSQQKMETPKKSKIGKENRRTDKASTAAVKVNQQTKNYSSETCPCCSDQNKRKLPVCNSCSCYAECHKCVCQVSTQVFGRHHVHHTIRMPAEDIKTKAKIRKENLESSRTWSDILKKGNENAVTNKNKVENENRDVPIKVTHKNSVDPNIKRTARPNRKEHTKTNEVLIEALNLLQKAVRDAQEEKEAARREAARNALAADKLKVLMEATAATAYFRHQPRSVEAEKKRIEELLAVERRNASMLQVEAVLEKMRCAAQSPSSRSSGSRKFKHSSPTPSKASLADATEVSWDEVSSIQGFQDPSFTTI